MKGYVKILRDAAPLVQSDPNSYLILSLAAFRAKWSFDRASHLDVGESYIGVGDFPYLTPEQYRQAIKRIKKMGFATIQGTNKGSIVSLANRGFAEFTTKETTNSTTTQQQYNNNTTTTNEEGKKVRKKKRDIPPPKKDVAEYFNQKGKSVEMAAAFFNYYESNGWKVGKNAMKSWQSAASGWISRQADFSNEPDRPALPPKIVPKVLYNPDGSITDLVNQMTVMP